MNPQSIMRCGKLLFILLVTILGCRDGKLPPPELGRGLAALKMSPESPAAGKLVLTSDSRRVVLFADSKVAGIDGIPVAMPEKTIFADNVWDLGENAVNNFIFPVVNGTLPKISTILIDAGHGGSDTGAISCRGHFEKDMNLLLAKALAEKLRVRGYKVFMTREDDRYLSLDERPAMIGRYNADVFISVHHNASSTNPQAAGSEIFILQAETPEETVLAARSIYMAFLLQKSFAVTGRFPIRGVKSARFKVLRQATCPAVLIEAGFVSNQTESEALISHAYRDEIAENLAAAFPQITAPENTQGDNSTAAEK